MSYSQSVRQARVNQAGENIERQKSSHFRGRAKVPLEFLHFSERSPRQLDRGNVERLMDAFRDEGVKRLQADHHIPAVVGKDDLQSAVRLSGLSLLDLLNCSQDNPPRLTFPEGFRLLCLHGKHRVEAAKLSACLQGEDRWWAVTLYSADLSKQARTSLVEDYSNSQRFSDGLIFRKIVEYETSDDYSRQHWWSWLTACKKDILSRILAHKAYSAALREMIRIPALLEDLNIAVWHKIIATRSDEEFLHYIARILATFDHICGRQERLWIALDSETVTHVQSRCPGASLDDLGYLQGLMQERRIFRAVDDATRQEIWTRLSEVKYLIPTLGSLQQDFKYMRGPATAVYRLLHGAERGRRGRRTLRDLAELAFLTPRRDGKIPIQSIDHSMQETAGCADDQFEIAFQQLYLNAMRESWDLVNDCPLKERTKETPAARSPDPIVWHAFAELASNLGFDSPEIRRLRQTDPFQEKARQVLLDRREWRCEDARLQQLLTDAAGLYEAESRNPSFRRREPQMLTNGAGEPVDRRRGRCYESAYERDKQHMFFAILSQPIDSSADSVTSLFIRKSVFSAFFPAWSMQGKARNVPEPKQGTNSTGTGEQDGDIDMSDAAATDRSSAGRDDADASLGQNADSTETAPGSVHSTPRGVEDSAVPRNGSTDAKRKRSVSRSSASSSPSTGPALLSPSSALQLVRVEESGADWARKRPRTAYILDTVGNQSGGEHASAGEPESSEETQMAVDSPTGSFASGRSEWEGAHAASQSRTEVTIWMNLEGEYKEREGLTCKSGEEVEEKVLKLQAEYSCYPSTSEGRGILLSECYSYATGSGGENRVYVTIDDEL